MIGKRFGKLTVLELSEYRGGNNRDKYYICQCDCGEITQLMGTAIRRKNRPTLNCKQCGDKKKVKHGMRGTKLYKAWDSMKYRCYNENCNHYKIYGGRGIIVCDEWLDKENGFLNFMNWSFENGFDEYKSIDRIDNDGNYEPDNCRWTDTKTQANNKSVNKIITYKGESKTMSQWAEEFKIRYGTFVKRLENGWNMERALNEPVIPKENNKLININEECYTYKEISEKFGININTLRVRYSQGIRGKDLIASVKKGGK